jgi:hypothetical protein
MIRLDRLVVERRANHLRHDLVAQPRERHIGAGTLAGNDRDAVDAGRDTIPELHPNLRLAVRGEVRQTVVLARGRQAPRQLARHPRRKGDESGRLTAGVAKQRDLVARRHRVEGILVEEALVDDRRGRLRFSEAGHHRARAGVEVTAVVA